MLRIVKPLKVEVHERALNTFESFDLDLKRLANVVRQL